jgi:hypothetical protein
MAEDYKKPNRVRSINPLQDEIEQSKGGGGIARYLLGKNIKPLTKEFTKFVKDKKFKIVQGPLKGKDVSSKDLKKIGKADILTETLKSRSKKYDKNMSSFSEFAKKRKQAIEDLEKYTGNIESRYITKQAKGGLIKGKPKLAMKGWK